MPLLRIVHVGYVLSPPPEDVQNLTKPLQAFGFAFTVGETPKGDKICGLKPERSAHPYGTWQLGVSFVLDCYGLE